MTGCKGYDLRGSDARTEIERTKEADTPGEIPGRSGLQADRRTETSLSCGAYGSVAKKWRKSLLLPEALPFSVILRHNAPRRVTYGATDVKSP